MYGSIQSCAAILKDLQHGIFMSMLISMYEENGDPKVLYSGA